VYVPGLRLPAPAETLNEAGVTAEIGLILSQFPELDAVAVKFNPKVPVTVSKVEGGLLPARVTSGREAGMEIVGGPVVVAAIRIWMRILFASHWLKV
jgi:hypothetical protein